MKVSRHGRPAPLAAAALLLAIAACGRADEPPATEDDSLYVLLIVDTLRRDALGCQGREGARTPRLDALAEQSVRFDQTITSSGWTLPSVASMLTGTWPELHKATGKRARLTPITEDLPVAAEVFDGAGYATLGVVNAAFLSPLLGIDRGFDRFDHQHAYNVEIRRADETVTDALAAIRAQGGRGMFALIHIFDPHVNYDPPDGFVEPFTNGRPKPPGGLTLKACIEMLNLRKPGEVPPKKEDLDFMRGLYQGEIAFVDQAIGRLIDGLKELGVWEKTTLVMTADHGEEFYDHGGFEHGHTLYDELIHVPLWIRLPEGRSGAGMVVNDPVRTIDILPTLFELSGIEQPPTFEGRSLLPLIAGEDDVPRPAFSQSTLYGADKISWRTDQYHLIYDRAPDVTKRTELYDWTLDPREQHDLADQEPELVEKLTRRLSRFYGELKQRGESISTPSLKDMSPATIAKYEKSLKDTGYVGRDDEEPEEEDERW